MYHILRTPWINPIANSDAPPKSITTRQYCLHLWLSLDVDECLVSHDCSTNAQCMNTDGSFICVCLEGYDGNGKVCFGELGCSGSLELP